MKHNASKFISLLLAFCMVFSLAACAKPESADKSSENDVTTVIDKAEDKTTVDEDDKSEGGIPDVDEALTDDELPDGDEGEFNTEDAFAEDSDDEDSDLPPVIQSSTGVNAGANTHVNKNNKQDEVAGKNPTVAPAPTGDYNESAVLVKVEDSFDSSMLGELDYESYEALYKGSMWYCVKLSDGTNTKDAVSYLTDLDTFAKVDYDYIMGTTDKPEDNPNYKDQVNLGLSNIPYGWTQNGKAPGGSPDVVVAVIDTGVDYTHLDLRNNIWVNTAEIPDNGKDDDRNGYIDDVHGWDCVGDDKDPMDDNGHGTHVAGIIAAENNKQGGIGVAYNCKVMVLKAGNSSGYFNNSDIAEAIQYAYMNGASVINMSFGGSNISIAVEDALENAYNSCILVAAAGNDSACNNLSCKLCDIVKVSYPAALPYVIGVMSTDKNGSGISSFSNYDHYPYDSIEYEVFAVGEGVGSTWPANKYACLNGTSMAAPTVSGIAALLRSQYSDREVYSTKFIQSQIVNTGTVNPYNTIIKATDKDHSVADVQEALTKLPKPAVNLYDYRVDDSISISSANNGNGALDAGETVRLYISLHNRGGVAKDVNVSIDTYRSEIGDEALTDPYFNFVNAAIQLSDIGTYSVRESGDKYFEIVVDEDCPNDYLVDFNIRFTYKNGLDEKDNTVYVDDGRQNISYYVSNGIYLPLVINEDTVLQADRLYLISHEIYVNENVTLTIDKGAKIISTQGCPTISNNGRIVCNGTQDQLIEIRDVAINSQDGYAEYSYVDFYNVNIRADVIDHCIGTEGHFSGNITNSKFVESSTVGNIENCQIIDSDVLSFDCNPYSTSSTASINHYSNCVFLSSRCTVSAGIRPAITLKGVKEIIRTEEKAYVIIECGFDGSHPYCNPIGFAYEANLLAGCFGGVLSEMTREEYQAIGIHSVLTNGSSLTVLNMESKASILLEVDNVDISLEEIQEAYDQYCQKYAAIPYFENVAILNQSTVFKTGYSLKNTEAKFRYNLGNVYWGTNDVDYMKDMITNYELYGQYTSVVPEAYLESPTESMWPMVSNVYILNRDGEAVTSIGTQTVKFVVEFNRDMDTNIPLNVTFGTIAPYADYKVNGEWTTARQWVGEYTLKSSIENGEQYIMISNAQAAEDAFFTAEDKTGRFTFTIDTTAAMAMNLQAIAKEEGIELTFAQDDYDTLLGYNIYRADSKDGNYVRLNPAILLPTDSTFLDENAEPGKTYWYTYTVVLTDFSESSPAGKVVATAMDTMEPSLYHTPVNQGYENNNLIISATASDNVGIQSVTLFYRAVGAAGWKSLVMSKQNDKFNATIFGSDVTLGGIEYYIVATDGINTVQKGNAETPYTVVVKSADSLLGKGDVDGNGNVTTKDALMLMQCLNGDLILADDAFKRADLDGNEKLSSAEALLILQYVNGKISALEM